MNKYSELSVIKVSRHQWQLTKPWMTPFGTVPSGFSSDGASVPRLLWIFFSPAGVLFEAAIIHDYLYTKGIMNKVFADTAFRLTALHFKVKKSEALIAYTFVKFLGKGSY